MPRPYGRWQGVAYCIFQSDTGGALCIRFDRCMLPQHRLSSVEAEGGRFEMDLAKSDKPRKGGGQQVTALVGLVQQGVRASE